MNSEKKAEIELVGDDGNGLFVECRWHKDRFLHSIGVVINDIRCGIIQSQEGNSDEKWPCSPPLQQIHEQTIGGDPALLAVGMAGSSHYSTSFLLTRESSIELQIESACSIPKSELSNPGMPEEFDDLLLGTTYQVLQPFFSDNHRDCSFTIRHSVSDNRQYAKVFVQESRCICLETTEKETSCLKLCPNSFNADQATQWKYRIRLC